MAPSLLLIVLGLSAINAKAQETIPLVTSPIAIDSPKVLFLAKSKKWMRLGHYKKNIFGDYNSSLQGSFFLSPSGATNPLLEIQQSIDILFNKNPSLQCKFLSRAQWLIKELDISSQKIQKCPERAAWKAKLNAKEAYLVFASSDLNNMSASFGHTFLRLHNPSNKGSLELIDYGINYAADTGKDSGALIALKGLFGGYFGFYSMLPYHQKLREYTNLEGRDIWEYKLNFSPTEIEELINHVLELEGSGSPYFFLNNNCSKQILELFEFVRTDLELTKFFADATIPIDTVKILATKTNLLGNANYRTSIQTKFRRDYALLSLNEKSMLKMAVKDPHSKIDDFTENTESKIRLLDATIDYFAIQSYRNQQDFSEKIYRLSIARAKLGASAIHRPIELENPLLSGDSSNVYLGVGLRGQDHIYRFKYRRAFHDLLSRDHGLSPYSHIEVLSFELEYFEPLQRTDLHQFTLLNLISTNPVTLLDTPTSWQFEIGTAPKLAPYFAGGVGYSLDIFNSRFTQLLFSKLFLDNPEEYIGLGFKSFLTTHHSQNLRSFFQVVYLPILNSTPIFSLEAGLSLDISKQVEMRLSAFKQDQTDTCLLTFIF